MSGKKTVLRVFITAAILSAGYFLGPKPNDPELNNQLQKLNMTPRMVEQNIIRRETLIKNIKPDNESRIVWNDSVKKDKTPYCIVYLHGFSASPEEGDPVHRDIARKFGCNLYLPRLYAHGLKEQEPLLELDEKKYLATAKEAVAEAACLGKKVIIMGTSTGCTFALYIASGNPDIAGLILYSPNVDLRDSRSFLLTRPWGLQIARMIVGGNYYAFPGPASAEKYWNMKYRIEAIVCLKNILEHTMTKDVFNKIKQPVLMCYYYKNEKEQDNIVSVPAMLSMFDQLGTVNTLKRKVAIPNAGTHAIASGLWSKGIADVERETTGFLEETLKMEIWK